MNTDCIIDKKQIRRVNEQYGGSLRMDAEIGTALERGKGKALFAKIAYLWKAILIGHPFTDGNKRTALMVALTILEECAVDTGGRVKERLVRELARIARENIDDVDQIERLIRYAVEGH